jgi:hypothetical protein
MNIAPTLRATSIQSTETKGDRLSGLRLHYPSASLITVALCQRDRAPR